VNFVSAYVTCTRCIADNKWDKELTEPCEICGPDRKYCFAPFNYEAPEDTEVIKFDMPIRAFTQWLLHFEEEMAKKMHGEEDVLREMGMIDGGSEDEEESDFEDDGSEAGEGRPARKKKKLKKCKFETVAYAHAGKELL
jgi:hypothetical protein